MRIENNQMKELGAHYGIILQRKASSLTQGNQCDWGESWGGFRGTNNC